MSQSDGLRQVEQEPLLSESNSYGAVAQKKFQDTTTSKNEYKFLLRSTAPVSVTFFFEYLLTAVSMFTVGHLGTTELAALSLVSVTVGVTGHAFIIGFTTCLDTLAAQAYGRGDLRMVGVFSQRCAVVAFLISIPVVMLWWRSDLFLEIFVEQTELVELASKCLKIYTAGLPGFIVFEVGKHFLQAQGNFHGPLYILGVVTPLNIFLNFYLVYSESLGLGLMGAPTAVVIAQTCMGIFLILYVRFIDGIKCWTRPTIEAFSGYGRLLNLAMAGVVMVEAEWLAFDFLTMLTSRLGTVALASQSICQTSATLAYQIPLALSVTASTRIGNLVGAVNAHAAKLSGQVALKSAVIVGTFNAIMMFMFRFQLGRVFSSDPEVIATVGHVLPLVAVFQLSDATGAVSCGILRGQGRQYIGGWINLIGYYVFTLPAAYILAFPLGHGLLGLWAGFDVGFIFVAALQVLFVIKSNWQQVCHNSE